MYDLIIRDGYVVAETGVTQADIGIVNGKIVAVAPELTERGNAEIDALGKLVFPGFIDAHTHMGIPIKDTTSADDFESGSIAAAFGGITSIIDFTVQDKGQTLRESVEARLQLARGKCHVDFGLHVNITDDPENRLFEIPRLIDQGLRYYKVFSTYREAGMMATWGQFRLILQKVDDNGGLVFLHAEDNHLVETMTAEYVEAGDFRAIHHPLSRTAEAEARAIRIAAEIAGELDASLYIVHVSSRAGLEAGLQARERGVNIYLETCPQYLLLTDELYRQEDGHYWITTPPLRTADDCDALWQALADGHIDVVATDHCPFTRQQKDAHNGAFHLTPNGLPGVETLFPLLYTYGVDAGRITLPQMLHVLATNPAKIFGVEGKKGVIAVGADADLVIWDPKQKTTVRAAELHGSADWSPYEGMAITGHLDTTVLRGRLLVRKGKFVGHDVFGESLCSP